ncbi:conserved hypothetical protein [Vibrio phage 409E50-1]|nr:hypothetical protein PODOV005v1_10033 [Vibrio phage PS32B.2]QZI86335.1 hypothetical protein PODOV028v1_10044 [Vibrio phage PS32B.3]QZI86362.1 hypothetical protein PODOV029v1_10009 [Vibrio phage PS35B.1]QZI86419.1 hypothetical protein PODOV027v1_10010 [Vibrio phage PS35B.3]QZI92224.1 hypothetical protein PODOV026v1_p0051 [Vibrio phage PS32B.1]QZI92267.1 hypothetical protein PODOV004v1_p0032 [Vibrio phage PS32B.11]QZI92348.1 hypothetical protein PODOV025v1_p0051 [Vibrio phage PS32B.6]CAH901
MEYKGFKIVADGTMGYKHITQPGSGAMPQALKGRYTTVVQAQLAIDNYKPKRGAKKNVKDTTTA